MRASRRWVLSSLAMLVVGCSGGTEPDPSPAPSQTAVEARADCEAIFGSGYLSGGGNSFGECESACSRQVGFARAGDCRQLVLSVSNVGPDGLTDGGPLATNAGELTEAGVAAGRAVAASLRDRTLLGSYGCPDCSDGGGSRIRIQSGTVESLVRYPYREPPPALEAADAYLQALLGALGSCTSSEWVDVSASQCIPVR